MTPLCRVRAWLVEVPGADLWDGAVGLSVKSWSPSRPSPATRTTGFRRWSSSAFTQRPEARCTESRRRGANPANAAVGWPSLEDLYALLGRPRGRGASGNCRDATARSWVRHPTLHVDASGALAALAEGATPGRPRCRRRDPCARRRRAARPTPYRRPGSRASHGQVSQRGVRQGAG